MNKTSFSQLILCSLKAFSKKFCLFLYSCAKTCEVRMLFKDTLCQLIEYKKHSKNSADFCKNILNKFTFHLKITQESITGFNSLSP